MPQVFECDSDPYLSTKQPSHESGARVELASGGSAGHHVVLVPHLVLGQALPDLAHHGRLGPQSLLGQELQVLVHLPAEYGEGSVDLLVSFYIFISI